MSLKSTHRWPVQIFAGDSPPHDSARQDVGAGLADLEQCLHLVDRNNESHRPHNTRRARLSAVPTERPLEQSTMHPNIGVSGPGAWAGDGAIVCRPAEDADGIVGEGCDRWGHGPTVKPVPCCPPPRGRRCRSAGSSVRCSGSRRCVGQRPGQPRSCGGREDRQH